MKTTPILRAVVFAAFALLPSLAPAQVSTPTVDPAGTFTIEFEFDNDVHTAELAIVKKEDRLAGTLSVHGQTMPLSTVTLEDRKLTITAAMPHGPLSMTVTFTTADKAEGSFTLNGEVNGTVTASRRK